ncbi:unnamed protein product [Heterobilharzia americana]|nr:unnamed protein product [Heterobilharzia americana]CAH8436224.1 unnamed protein product [Heterobilharzia americana]
MYRIVFPTIQKDLTILFALFFTLKYIGLKLSKPINTKYAYDGKVVFHKLNFFTLSHNDCTKTVAESLTKTLKIKYQMLRGTKPLVKLLVYELGANQLNQEFVFGAC